ncbi:SET domain-containing protein [Schizopora paradoxa]|uniref:SET domain-containing protein n=1 Tax=Schizopora paradoxa TaxID=27342 RepID=A0A0H2RC50_9AGAM|nr:SET domain-containing protein [Schizopora paradoxa]
MSFADKRKHRGAREQKSYVPLSGVGHPTGASSSTDREDQPGNSSGEKNHEISYGRHHVDEEKAVVAPSDVIGKREEALEDGYPRRAEQSVDSPRAAHETSISQVDGALYAELPNNLVILKTEDRGRGIWTTQDVKAGTVLFSIRPHVHVLSRSQLTSFCTSCCTPNSSTALKKCTKCRVVHYCSAACQNADWGFHKSECEALRRWASDAPQIHADDEKVTVPAEAVRCLGRIILKRKKEGVGSRWWKEIEAMQTHRQTLAEPVENEVHLAHALVRYLGVNGPEALAKYDIRGVGELVDFISKFATNSFTLSTPSLSPIGVAVSPLAALINHSCDPNVAILFPRPGPSNLPAKLTEGRPNPEPVLQVVAITDIPAKSELFTSYVDTTMPFTQRQKDLKETYKFTCKCNLCSPADRGAYRDYRGVVWCPRSCGGVCPIPLEDVVQANCSNCQAIVEDKDSVLDAVRVGQEALDKATSLSASDPTKALHITRNILKTLVNANLTPATHPLLAIYRLHLSLLLPSLGSSGGPTEAALDEAIDIAAKSVAGLCHLLRPGHPVRGIALAELGKLLAVDEPETTTAAVPASSSTFPPNGPDRLKLAVTTLRQAMDELRIGFGAANDGGEVGREVREILANAEKEMSVWDVRIRETLEDTIKSSKKT